MTDKPIILWFRRDLRLTDHAALAAAIARKAPVIPVFILDDGAAGAWNAGGASRWWLHHSLESLAAGLGRLGSGLVLRRGDSAETILALAKEVGASAIHTGIAPEPWERASDDAIAAALEGQGCAFHRHQTMLMHDPDAVTTQAGKPFSVFTPFANAFGRAVHPAPPAPAPKRLPKATLPKSDALADWRLLPTIGWDAGMAAHWTPGETGAAEMLTRFVAGAAEHYDVGRNEVAKEGSSSLSPYLHWGEISPWQVWAALEKAKPGAGVTAFRRELVWREFAGHVLWHHPTLPEEALRGPACLAAGPDRRADRRRRDAAALVHRLDAQPGADDRRLLPDQAPTRLLAGWGGLVLGYAGRWRPRQQQPELAVGGGLRRGPLALLPDLQPCAARKEVRSRRGLCPPLGAGADEARNGVHP
jgi:deoxyribodipyrimidine photo-lyase